MLAYYYQKRMAKSKIKEEFTNILGGTYTTPQDLSLACRVCLNKGSTSIYERENTQKIIEALQIFGNITVRENDHTKLLCSGCYKFIMQAIMLRQIAMKTNEILKMQVTEVKIEMIDNTIDENHDVKSESYEKSTQYPIMMPTASEPERNLSNVKESNEKRSKTYVEKNETENLYVSCHICKKVLMRNSLKKHLLLHDDNSKFVCHVCGKAFKTQTNYQKHSWVHKTEFIYKCKDCPYRSKTPYLLNMHMKTHNGDHLMCTECPATFLFRSNLNSHMQRKHREPQFQCDFCKKAFHTKPLLKVHIEGVHLGIQKNVCEFCNKTFKYRKNMLEHQNNLHNRKKLLYSRMPFYLLAENTNKDPE